MKYGLKDEIYDKILNIARKNKQYKFILFGSRARGKYKKESDKSDHCSYCPVWYMTKRKLSYKKNMEELVSHCESKINFHPDLEYVGNRVNCKNYCVMPYDRKYFVKEIEVEE